MRDRQRARDGLHVLGHHLHGPSDPVQGAHRENCPQDRLVTASSDRTRFDTRSPRPTLKSATKTPISATRGALPKISIPNTRTTTPKNTAGCMQLTRRPISRFLPMRLARPTGASRLRLNVPGLRSRAMRLAPADAAADQDEHYPHPRHDGSEELGAGTPNARPKTAMNMSGMANAQNRATRPRRNRRGSLAATVSGFTSTPRHRSDRTGRTARPLDTQIQAVSGLVGAENPCQTAGLHDRHNGAKGCLGAQRNKIFPSSAIQTRRHPRLQFYKEPHTAPVDLCLFSQRLNPIAIAGAEPTCF